MEIHRKIDKLLEDYIDGFKSFTVSTPVYTAGLKFAVPATCLMICGEKFSTDCKRYGIIPLAGFEKF